MQDKSLVLTVVLAAFAGSALAQNKISGNTAKCDKPDTEHVIEAGDQAGHILVLAKYSCTFSVPIEMAGLKSTTYTLVVVGDVTGAKPDHGFTKAQDRGYSVITMDNGDKAYMRIQGTGSEKEEQGTWSYTGGTGKLKGLKGKGTYKGSGTPDGGDQVEGEYSLPEASATAKKK